MVILCQQILSIFNNIPTPNFLCPLNKKTQVIFLLYVLALIQSFEAATEGAKTAMTGVVFTNLAL